VGAAAAAAGWDWALLLIAFFIASTGISRLGRDRKERRGAGVVTKGTERDAAQVVANGGAFAVCALGAALWPAPAWYAAGAGALAAAAADTWATEVGMLVGGTPRSIRSWRPVAPGTSGGITAPGTLAAVAGAAFVAAVAVALGWSGVAAWSAVGGGLVGATVDSAVGATLQARRWCDRCNAPTERALHPCGAPSRAAGGLAWLDNDAVNAVSTVVGALVALIAAGILGRSTP
jgi:uncharacterized protein (TIGR00297 family)